MGWLLRRVVRVCTMVCTLLEQSLPGAVNYACTMCSPRASANRMILTPTDMPLLPHLALSSTRLVIRKICSTHPSPDTPNKPPPPLPSRPTHPTFCAAGGGRDQGDKPRPQGGEGGVTAVEGVRRGVLISKGNGGKRSRRREFALRCCCCCCPSRQRVGKRTALRYQRETPRWRRWRRGRARGIAKHHYYYSRGARGRTTRGDFRAASGERLARRQRQRQQSGW